MRKASGADNKTLYGLKLRIRFLLITTVTEVTVKQDENVFYHTHQERVLIHTEFPPQNLKFQEARGRPRKTSISFASFERTPVGIGEEGEERRNFPV